MIRALARDEAGVRALEPTPGFCAVLGLMISVAAGMASWFGRRGWL